MTKKSSIQDRARMALGEQFTAPAEAAAAPEPAAPTPEPAAKQSGPQPRLDDIRLSVALAPKLYHPLVTYTNELAMQLGVSRVPHVVVVRALLEELQSNPELGKRITERITEVYRNN